MSLPVDMIPTDRVNITSAFLGSQSYIPDGRRRRLFADSAIRSVILSSPELNPRSRGSK